jgi:hypothetical protein
MTAVLLALVALMHIPLRLILDHPVELPGT